jgi:hypothetical protein
VIPQFLLRNDLDAEPEMGLVLAGIEVVGTALPPIALLKRINLRRDGPTNALTRDMKLTAGSGSLKRGLSIKLLVVCVAFFVALVGSKAHAQQSACAVSIAVELPEPAQLRVRKATQVIRSMRIYDDYVLSANTLDFLALVKQPDIKSALTEMNLRMIDIELWAQYVEDLASEAFNDMLESEDPYVRIKAEKGELLRDSVLKVLVRRARARGLSVGKVEKLLNRDDFTDAIRSGPFVDFGVGKSPHGVYTHLLQLDFVSDIVEKKLGGDFKRFHRYLGSLNGVALWTLIFDRNSGSTPHHPEYLGPKLSEALSMN